MANPEPTHRRIGWHLSPQGHVEYLDARGDRVTWLPRDAFDEFRRVWAGERATRRAMAAGDP